MFLCFSTECFFFLQCFILMYWFSFSLLLFAIHNNPFSNSNAMSVITRHCCMPTKQDRPLTKQDYLEICRLLFGWTTEAIQDYMHLSLILFKLQMKTHKVKLAFYITFNRQEEPGKATAGLVSYDGRRKLSITDCRPTLCRPPAMSATGNHHSTVGQSLRL